MSGEAGARWKLTMRRLPSARPFHMRTAACQAQAARCGRALLGTEQQQASSPPGFKRVW